MVGAGVEVVDENVACTARHVLKREGLGADPAEAVVKRNKKGREAGISLEEGLVDTEAVALFELEINHGP